MPHTEPTRLPELMSTDRAQLDALFASTVVGHVGFVDDGLPVVLPTIVVSWGDRLVMHGSTGSRWMRRVASGIPVSVSVAAVDGVLVARSAFESALLYRSAVLFGAFALVEAEERLAALDVLTERLLPGRVAEVRRPTSRELAATQLLAMPIREWSLRIFDSWPEDPPEDVAGPAWAGQVRFGTPPITVLDAPDLRVGIPAPTSANGIDGVR